ncbi:class I SAM-dependent methyltransferase [Candidatus Gottesmanbacteria bacterium]|nr:class I SAM-dependent methyltransferase [Candidatus Gottesmanbacteria bacterium]
MHHDHIDRVISVYNAIADTYAHAADKLLPQPELKLFSQLVVKGGKILDAGCGSGRDVLYFIKHNFQAVGVDLSNRLLEIARKKTGKAEFYKQDLRHLDFPKTHFDGIWACASLVHLARHEVLPVLQSFYQLLKPRGVLFLSVKEGKGEADVREALSQNFARHYIFFTMDELDSLVQRAGFMLVKSYIWSEKDRDSTLRDFKWISYFCRKP